MSTLRRLRVGSSTALGVLLLAMAGRATAQTAPAPEIAAPAVAPAGVDPRTDDVWTAYHEAFTALVRGDRVRARQLLEAIMLLHPTHPAAALARGLAATSASPSRSLPVARSRNGKTNGARAELVVFQTLHGVAAGFEVCAADACSGVRSHAVSLMVMGGLGLGLSLGLTRDGVRPGDTAALDAGTFWGAWNGLALARADGASSAHTSAGMLVGQGLGLGAGLLVAVAARPTAGQVSLSSTVATWTTTMTLLALIATSDNRGIDDAHLWIPLVLASDVGLAAGGVLGHGSSISRGRAALIDTGGALGLLVGALMATGGDTTARKAGFTMMAGTSLGLLCAILATLNWDDPAGATATTTSTSTSSGAPTVSFLPTPMPGGGGAGLILGGTF